MLHITSGTIKRASFDHSSTQINLPSDIVKKVIDWGKEVISDADIYTETGERTYGRESEIHCTVKYGLHTIDAEEIKNKVSEFGSFDVELGEVSRFTPTDKPYDVVKIAVEGDGLFALNEILCELPNADDYPVYKPHVTIAYVKSGTNYELSGKRPFAGMQISITEITFSPKTGDRVHISL